MTEAAKKDRREYYREWRRRNPERVRAAQERYWEKRIQGQRNPEQRAAADPERQATAD